MRVCVTSKGNEMGSEVDQRFGRCAYLIVVDTDTMEYEAILNGSVGVPGGAGVRMAQVVAKLDVQAVLTGNVGPRAFEVLQAAGIKVYVDITGSVGEAVEKLKGGQLGEPVGGPSVPQHHGISD